MKVFRALLAALLLAAQSPAINAAEIQLSLPDKTPVQRGEILRKILAAVEPGTRVQLEAEDFDLGGKLPLIFPPKVAVYGRGPQLTSLRNRAPVQLVCQFENSDGTELGDMSLWTDTPNVNDIGVCVGFSQATKTYAPTARHVNIVAIGREHGGYNWGPTNAKIIGTDSWYKGKWGFTAGSGSGPNSGAQCEFTRCRFTGDTRTGTVGGDSGNMVFGYVQRGGFGKLTDCLFESLAFQPVNDDPKNPKTAERQACVWLGLPEHRYDAVPPTDTTPGKPAGSTWASVDLVNPRTAIQTFTGVPEVYQFVCEPGSYDGVNPSGRFRVLVSPPQKPAPTYLTQGDVEVLNDKK